MVSKEKKGSREENSEEKAVSFYFFLKCMEEQSQADVQLVPTDAAGETGSVLMDYIRSDWLRPVPYRMLRTLNIHQVRNQSQ